MMYIPIVLNFLTSANINSFQLIPLDVLGRQSYYLKE